MGEQDAPLQVTSRTMQVRYPPRVTVGPVSVYNVEKGTIARLECSAEGNPTPTGYRWEQTTGRGNFRQDSSEAQFTADRDHTGNYTCTARNSEGEGRVLVKCRYGDRKLLYSKVIGVDSVGIE